MMRLVQGDVGSGKTVVAAPRAARGRERQAGRADGADRAARRAALRATSCGWLEPLGMRVALLSGSQPASARAALDQALAAARSRSPSARTHCSRKACGSTGLALVIVDEQHRFGVHQRLRCARKACGRPLPHQLVMTATPIPRTLAMTAYADLDVSVIDELPPGRTPIRTVVLPDEPPRRGRAAHRGACREGRQAYWVCPLIEESEELRAQAAEETAARSRRPCPACASAWCTGACRPPPRRSVMDEFKGGKRPAAGRHHRHRGRRRRAERQPDGDRERRAHRPGAAAPAARPRRSRRAGVQLRAAVPRAALAAGARAPRHAARHATTASRSPARTWSCAAPANCSARARPASCSSRSRTWSATPTCCRACRRRRH